LVALFFSGFTYEDVQQVCEGLLLLGETLVKMKHPFTPHLFNQNRLEGLFGVIRSRSSTGALSAAMYQDMLGVVQFDNSNHLHMKSVNYQ
jgi:hypothetical protein